MGTVIHDCLMSSGQIEGHDYVDLGLPSGLKWGTCNVGATKPFEFGDYFAWGEVSPKDDYSDKTYKWGAVSNLTKYCTPPCPPFFTQYGEVDDKTTLDSEDDAATVIWGKKWRIPAYEEFQELVDGCEWEQTNDFNRSGVAGFWGRSRYNGNCIFFPAAGYRVGEKYYADGGHYYSSQILTRHPFDTMGFEFYSRIDVVGGISRHSGHSVRAVATI